MTRASQATNRLRCCVPFCKGSISRARYPSATEAICADHWRLTDRAMRREYLKLYDRAEAKRIKADCDAVVTLWDALKRQACDAALGQGAL